MRFNILSDSNWEARIDRVEERLSSANFREFFENRNYGKTLEGGITLVLMCRDPEYNFKQRIRYSKKEKKLYIDLMFDLNQFELIEQSERDNNVVEKIINEVPNIVAKYKFKDFDLERFTADLREIFGNIKK